MNPKGTFRGSLAERFVIFSRQPTERGKPTESEGVWRERKRMERERMFGSRRKKVKKTSRINIFPFRKSGRIVFRESSAICIYIYVYTLLFLPSIFASSFPCPIVFQAYSCPKAHSLDHSSQYPVPLCIMCLIYRFLLFRIHLDILKDFWGRRDRWWECFSYIVLDNFHLSIHRTKNCRQVSVLCEESCFLEKFRFLRILVSHPFSLFFMDAKYPCRRREGSSWFTYRIKWGNLARQILERI